MATTPLDPVLFIGVLAVIITVVIVLDNQRRKRSEQLFNDLRAQLGGEFLKTSSLPFPINLGGKTLRGTVSSSNFLIQEFYEREGKHSQRFILCIVQSASQKSQFSFSRIDGLGDQLGSSISSALNSEERIGNITMLANDRNAARDFLNSRKPQIDRLLALGEPFSSSGIALSLKMRKEFGYDAGRIREAVQLLAEIAK